jgi:hypothetical protein
MKTCCGFWQAILTAPRIAKKPLENAVDGTDSQVGDPLAVADQVRSSAVEEFDLTARFLSEIACEQPTRLILYYYK